jgi:DNA-directed RNA polymerase specialized sigma24 family protein
VPRPPTISTRTSGPCWSARSWTSGGWLARVRLFRETPEPPPFEDGGIEDRQVVRAALSQVPRRQQAVLVLRFFYDLPVHEVAGMLGCSSGTVKSQTARGLATLRRLLGERELAGCSATK